MSKIPFREVRDLITAQKNSKVECIKDIESSCNSNFNCKEFHKQTKNYKLEKSLKTVWENYCGNESQKVYNSKKLSLGLILCKKNVSNKILYPNSVFTKLDTGQVIYLKLKFIKGLLKMAVAFEINKIDTINKIIEFSYIKGGKSRGKQILEFKEDKENKTTIVHTSYYKSQSKVRDFLLYPFFHSKVTDEFHKNFKKVLIQNTANSIASN
jgi:hypothetical protein